jgi:Lon protease-like protein
MTTVVLPIFPLGVVLFPGTALPLHLFEPRYRQLLTDIRAGDSRFGILPGVPGTPERELPTGRFGCIAEVTDVELMPDGRSNIVVQGRERFALDAFVDAPTLYHQASVTVVDAVGGESPVALAVAADELAANFKRVVAAVHTLNDNPAPPPPLPDHPAQIAWSVAAMIDIDVEQRYALLAERAPGVRIAQVDRLLRKVLPDLELRAAMHASRS